jgi:hypothetical protein
MFVVRLKLPDAELDFKAFAQRADAQKRFRVGQVRVAYGDVKEAAIFEVTADNPKIAIDLVAAGNTSEASLLDVYQ